MLPMDTSLYPSQLCVVRRTQSMEDLERRLQFALVVYAGGARRDLTPEFILDALHSKADIEAKWVYIHRFKPEGYIVVFARLEQRNRVSAMPAVDHKGVQLFFRPWNRQAHAVHAMFQFKVRLVLEGIPPHAWDREVVECLLSSSCLVDMLEPDTSSRVDLSAFKLSAWTAQPEEVPLLRWLAVPDPGMRSPLMEPTLLQYKVLIHLDEVSDCTVVEEPAFLGVSSGSGQSGIPDLSGSRGAGAGVVPVLHAEMGGLEFTMTEVTSAPAMAALSPAAAWQAMRHSCGVRWI
ncbi:hypothetical protein CFC21_006458 [Triticum aestivum]|uniref:DUF4283 domain-containing protein n=2 Tax=Triticum aestivum TaxID=4565 RepID=A0A9R1DCD3_WHEAT|nr:hypothetical protein CFC21_006457 [Triticum aestivum]KAF6989068.1 hypothetical protein CFC21_006458 [Triticum aestivum]